MGNQPEMAPDSSDDESGDAFTDGDFGDSDEETLVERNDDSNTSKIPVNETLNAEYTGKTNGETHTNGFGSPGLSQDRPNMNGVKNGGLGHSSDFESCNSSGGEFSDSRRDSHGDLNPSIVGILGDQHNHAEQRLAARRAARAEAREIRMRELERQQREQADHADKAYDMYAGDRQSVGRRSGGGARLPALSPSTLHSPRRSSEDSDDTFSIKDLRHELKEVEEKFRKAMILNAQLDNDKAALGYQLELLKDRLDELQEQYAQLQREHKEKCSAHERLKRSHASLEREVESARSAIMARDAAVNAAGFAFVDATQCGAVGDAGGLPALELVTHESEQLLNDAGEGTLDVRLQKLLQCKQSLESEVRKLKLTLNEERAARQNGVSHQHDMEYESELEQVRKSVVEAKSRASRAEAEAALQSAACARLDAQLARVRARSQAQDAREEALAQDKRRLQREAREALNRVEELETENSHLTKRLDKLKNAKSALLKEL